MSRNHDRALIFLMFCVLVMVFMSLLSGCAFVGAVASGVARTFLVHKITTKGERPVNDPTDVDTIDLCDQCGLTRDECGCDLFDGWDEDQYEEADGGD